MRRSVMVAALLFATACGDGSSQPAEPVDSAQQTEAGRDDTEGAAEPDDTPAATEPSLDRGGRDDVDGDDADADDADADDVDADDVDADDVDREDVTEPTVSVEIDPPEGWERADEPRLVAASGGDGAVYLNEAACHEGFCAHLHATVMPGAVHDLEAYHTRSQDELQEVLGAEMLTAEEATVDGYDGYQLTYRVDDADDTLRYRQRYALVDEQVVVATFVAPAQLLDQWRADAEALLESVAVTPDE